MITVKSLKLWLEDIVIIQLTVGEAQASHRVALACKVELAISNLGFTQVGIHLESVVGHMESDASVGDVNSLHAYKTVDRSR